MATPEDSVRSLSYRDLQALAKSLNVKAIGRREELVERLLGLGENLDACPSTPDTKCEKTEFSKMGRVSTPAPPSTPSSSLADALKKLPINTPRARATPRSHYKTRSVSKSHRPSSPSKDRPCPSASGLSSTSEGEMTAPCSSSRFPQEVESEAPAKSCTSSPSSSSAPSTLNPEGADESIVPPTSDAIDVQNPIASFRLCDGTPRSLVPETHKRDGNGHGCSPVADSATATMTNDTMPEMVEAAMMRKTDAEGSTSPAFSSRALSTIDPEGGTQETESSVACVKLFSDDPVECTVENSLGDLDQVESVGQEEGKTDESGMADVEFDIERSSACTTSIRGSPAQGISAGDPTGAQHGPEPEGKETGSVARGAEVMLPNSCAELAADDNQDTMREEVTLTDSCTELAVDDIQDTMAEATKLDCGSEARGSEMGEIKDHMRGKRGGEEGVDQDVDGGKGEDEQGGWSSEGERIEQPQEEAEVEVHKDGKEDEEDFAKEVDRNEGNRNVENSIAPPPSELDPDTRHLVITSGFLDLVKNDTRVFCTLTGEEILPTFDEIAGHLDKEHVQELLAERQLNGHTKREEKGEEVHEAVSEKAPHQIDDRTRKLVESSSYLAFTQNEERVRVVCTLTGHEVKPDYMDILKYLSSKRVQRLLEHGPFDIEEYAGMFIVEDPKDVNHVICELTGAKLFKCRQTIVRHLNGQQYKKALEKLGRDNNQGETTSS